MIQYIGATTDCTYLCRSFSEFLKWITYLREVEFDIETTVTPHWCTKEIITVQFGNTDTQWVLQWSYLSAEERAAVKQILESQSWMKLIHNAAFECIVCLFHGIRIRNVFDTMLAEQVRWGGDQTFVGYSLEELCLRRLHIQLDKRYQTLFGDNILTDGKIVYAAQDVAHLSVLKKEIYQECQQFGLEWTIALENESVIAFSEMVSRKFKDLLSKLDRIVSTSQSVIADGQVTHGHLGGVTGQAKFFACMLISQDSCSEGFVVFFQEIVDVGKSQASLNRFDVSDTDTFFSQ